MNENLTTKQLVLFTLVTSFMVSVIGTVLALGVIGPLLSGESVGTPFSIIHPNITQQKTVVQKSQSQDDLITAAVAKTSPAVVSIVASKYVPVIEQYYVDPFQNDPFFQQYFGGQSPFEIPQYKQNGTKLQEVSAGSGFIVSTDGIILTNKHVVSDTSASYTVFLNDGRKLPAKVLARDPIQDLAIVKIEGTNFPTVSLGDSSKVKLGQTAIAIGNALGEFRNTVSVGVVSGLQRSVIAQDSQTGPESLQELIQTDAAINPGNSGGPLLDINGNVIGIDTAIAQNAQNIGFALPINKAKKDISNVEKTGKIIYPYLGVRYVIVTPDLVTQKKLGKDYGAYIEAGPNGEPAVVAGGPADKAGVNAGDIILSVDGQKIDSNNTLGSVVESKNVGDTITLHIFRDGKEMDLKATLEELKQ